MCDTMTAFLSADHSFFVKNSDRDPAEFQFVYISTDPLKEFREEPFQYQKEEYINNSFQTLKRLIAKYDCPHKAILSKPDWIWGAEMGVNEFGLAIGNEAVFSRGKVPEDGLLGMDILRLALHNCKNASEALEFIIEIIENYPQGGNGSFSGKLYYHNSFLIKDFKMAFILETAADKWAVKNVGKFAAISNAYSIGDDYHSSSTGLDYNLKEKHENKFISFFSKGNIRQQMATKFLQENEYTLKNMFKLTRLHRDNADIKRGMTSTCMHPGLLIKSETTSSMVIEYREGNFLTWFTGSPNPCISLYKPLLFTENLEDHPLSSLEYAYKYSKKWREYSRAMIRNHKVFQKDIRSLRDQAEEEMIGRMSQFFSNGESDRKNLQDISLKLAEKYLLSLEDRGIRVNSKNL